MVKVGMGQVHMLPAGADVQHQVPAAANGLHAAADRSEALVELAGVSRRYGRLVALRDIDLVVDPGEFVFLTGPSEAGKSTLLKLIHGDLRPTRGTVRVSRYRLNRRWRGFLPRLRRQVGAIFQE